MALAYRAGSFVSAGNASGGNLSLTKPTGTVAGDRLAIVVYFEPDTTTITISDGPWESVVIANTGSFRLQEFVKIAGASEPASYTISNSTAGDQWRTAVGVAYSGGTGSGTLIDVSATAQADAVNGSAIIIPSVTTTGADRMCVGGFGDFSGNNPSSVGTGWFSALRGAFGGTAILDEVKATAGATGTCHSMAGLGTEDYAAAHLALISDIAGGGVTHEGAAAVTISLTTAAAGHRLVEGAGTGTLALTSAAAAAVEANAAAAATIALASTATAQRLVDGAAAATISLSTAGDGAILANAVAAATVDLTTAATGAVEANASAAATIDLTSTATGGIITEGAAAATIALATAADAQRLVSGEATAALSLTTAADGTLLAAGAGAATVDLTTAADGTLIAAGAATATLAITTAADGTVVGASLTAPSSLIATAVSSSQINLSWSDTNSIEDGTVIERSPAGAGTWAVIGEVGVDVVTFNDTGLPGATSFDYRVRAFVDEAA